MSLFQHIDRFADRTLRFRMPAPPGDRTRSRRTHGPVLLRSVIAMLISLSLAIANMTVAGASEGGDTTPLPAVLTLDDFSRDFAMFDSDMANGNNSADIPRAGTASPGALVEARIVTEAGAPVEPWQVIATADSAGDWSGVIRTGRNAEWLRVEARLQANPSLTVATTHRFGVGLIFFYSRQSNGVRLTTARNTPAGLDPSPYGVEGNPNLVPGPIVDNNAMQIISIDNRGAPNDPDTGVLSGFIRIGHQYRAKPVQEMASILTRNAPGLKVLMVVDVKAGAAMHDTFQDKNNRDFARVQALVNAVTADGAKMGAFLFNHNTGLDDDDAYPRNLGRLILNKEPDGSPFIDPITGVGNLEGGFAAAEDCLHTWLDLFPELATGRTRVLLGPDNFGVAYGGGSFIEDEKGQMKDYVPYGQFIADWSDPAKYNMPVEHAPIHLGFHNILWGWPNAAGNNIDDGIHYTANHDLGTMEGARGMMTLVLSAVGAIPDVLKARVDNVEWNENYIRIRSSAGPFTTYAHEKGLDLTAARDAVLAAGNTPPDAILGQDVLGFMSGPGVTPYTTKFIDPDATDPITAPATGKGDIVVFPPAGETFNGDSIVHAWQAGGGMKMFTRDYFNYGRYLLPVIDVGVMGWTGMTPYQRPGERAFINVNYADGSQWNTLPPATSEPRYVTPANHGSWQGGPLPANTRAMTFEGRFRDLAGNSRQLVFHTNFTGGYNFRTSFEILPDFKVNTRIKRVGVSNPVWDRTGAIPGVDLTAMQTYRVVYDLPRKTVRLFIDGVEFVNAHYGVPGALNSFADSKFEVGDFIRFMGRGAEIEYFRMWFAAEADGSLPSGTPDYEMVATSPTTFDTSGGTRSLTYVTN